ncbi:MAG: tRNA dihydrouridine(20/20a) synthase DusA [Calditrichaeota bacterium]|nr:tRNA dihydrouridine(20/20a) synthase DusA [Calditrichota bacterium]
MTVTAAKKRFRDSHRLCVAPMMDWTDRHFRYFMRQITRHTRLYTEMIPTGAILFGNRQRFLDFNPCEHPIAIQLGGSDARQLAECARIAEDWGYDEINLNVGCPSERVQGGRFGACLMATPDVVARAVEAMSRATNRPITVKHRIGIDDLDTYDHLKRFVEIVHRAGCQHFIVHARIAILKGLGPRENRTIPPLRYEDVYRLKSDFPFLTIVINGGIRSLEEAQRHLQIVDGVMIGRAAYENPYLFALADAVIFNDPDARPPTRREIIQSMIPYIDRCREDGIYPRHILRHMLGLFANQPGSRRWRRFLSEQGQRKAIDGQILLEAMALIPDHILDERPDFTTQSIDTIR